MKTILTALGTAGLLALTACGGGGGGGEAEANNSTAATDDLALPPENGTDPLATGGDTLENQANALDANLSAGNATDLNTTGNASSDLNATANTATGNTTNTQ